MQKLRRKIYLFVLVGVLFSCGKSDSSALTGWKFNDEKFGNFSINKSYKGQQVPPGMVLIEGGSFTMGAVQEDFMGDWNTVPRKMQVRSFYMDETEVTNAEYLFYLLWLQRVFPPSKEIAYRNIYKAALPDTLVWRNVLGNNDPLSQTYLRHPAFSNYPVVGVSWLQANDYCSWRTDRVNERILMEMGVLKDLYSEDDSEETKIVIEGERYFNTDLYYTDPKSLFRGDSTIYNPRGLERFNGRHLKQHDGVLLSRFRLPTEAEWEYAAKSIEQSREYNNLKGRKKYPWEGRSTRSGNKKGDHMANFKQSRGDYNGLPGWSNDNADITIAVKSYKPNDFGLYDMAGNVAEWVFDIYEPYIDNGFNDFNYTRGKNFKKRVFDEKGSVRINSLKDVVFDTLKNGAVRPRALPGSLRYKDSEKGDARNRLNYAQPNDTKEIPDSLRNDPNILIKMYANRNRVYKGGSWRDREFWLDPAQRRYLPEYVATDFIGFRCASDRMGNASTRKSIGKR